MLIFPLPYIIIKSAELAFTGEEYAGSADYMLEYIICRLGNI